MRHRGLLVHRFTSEREFDGYWQLSATRMMIHPTLSPSAKKDSDWLENNPGKRQWFPQLYSAVYAEHPSFCGESSRSSLYPPLPHGVWKTLSAGMRYTHFYWTGSIRSVHELPCIDNQGMDIFQPALVPYHCLLLWSAITPAFYTHFQHIECSQIWRKRTNPSIVRAPNMSSPMTRRRTSLRW